MTSVLAAAADGHECGAEQAGRGRGAGPAAQHRAAGACGQRYISHTMMVTKLHTTGTSLLAQPCLLELDS